MNNIQIISKKNNIYLLLFLKFIVSIIFILQLLFFYFHHHIENVKLKKILLNNRKMYKIIDFTNKIFYSKLLRFILLISKLKPYC